MREFDEVEWRSELVLSPDNLHDKIILDDFLALAVIQKDRKGSETMII